MDPTAGQLLTFSWILLFSAATAELGGQLLLKQGLDRLPATEKPAAFLWAMGRSRQVLLAFLLLAFWMGGYLLALRVLPVSAAFPAQSLNAFLLVVASRLVLKERIGKRRWLGASMIALGVYLVAGG